MSFSLAEKYENYRKSQSIITLTLINNKYNWITAYCDLSYYFSIIIIKQLVMNKLQLTAIVSLGSILFAGAQEFRGRAVYESQITFSDDVKAETSKVGEKASEQVGGEMGDELGKLLEEAFAKGLQKTYTLNFDKTASLYEEEKKIVPETPGLQISIMVSDEGGIEYKNIKEKRMVTETTLFDKEFLITDSLTKYNWKLENETKKIGNYTCYKATAVIKPSIKENIEEPANENSKTIFLGDAKPKDLKITAWYTPEIPVGHGPGSYWGLPGLILEANDGTTTLLCSKIVLNPKEKVEIKAPKKGKKVTKAEFRKIEEEKAREFEEQNGDDGIMIKIGG